MPCRMFYQLFILLAVFQSSFTQRRIKDGKEVVTDKPYVVYILGAPTALNLYHGWMCGGAIISKDFVITSAACVVDVKHMYVVPGYKNYVPPENIEDDDCVIKKRKKVVQTCVPKDYEFDYNATEVWTKTDIALVKVESPFIFTDPSYKEICSYTPKPIEFNVLDDFPEPGSDVLVFGWGHNKEYRKIEDLEDMNTKNLKYASTKVISANECKKYFIGKEQVMKSLISSSLLCTLGAGNQNDNGETVLREGLNDLCITMQEKLDGKDGELCETDRIADEVILSDGLLDFGNDNAELSDILGIDGRRTSNNTNKLYSSKSNTLDTYVENSKTPEILENNTRKNLNQTKNNSNYKSTLDIFYTTQYNSIKYDNDFSKINSSTKLNKSSRSSHNTKPYKKHKSQLTRPYLNDKRNNILNNVTPVVKLSTINRQLKRRRYKENSREEEDDLLGPPDPGVYLPYIYNDEVNDLKFSDEQETNLSVNRRNPSKSTIIQNKFNFKKQSEKKSNINIISQNDDNIVPVEANVPMKVKPVTRSQHKETEISTDLSEYDVTEITMENFQLEKSENPIVTLENEQTEVTTANFELEEIETLSLTLVTEESEVTSNKIELEETETPTIFSEPEMSQITKKNGTDPEATEMLSETTIIPAEFSFELIETESPTETSGPKHPQNRSLTSISEEIETTTDIPENVLTKTTKSKEEDSANKQNKTKPNQKNKPEYLRDDEKEHPESDETETPEPNETETPELDQTETAEPDKTETPEPDQTETAEPDKTETPELDKTENPEPDRTETFEPDKTENPTETIDETELKTGQPEEGTTVTDTPEIEPGETTPADMETSTAETTSDRNATLDPAVVEKVLNTPGICQNDHGGPLVAWRNGKEVLVAVATLFRLNSKRQCVGPYLYTKTSVSSEFIKCIVAPNRANRRRCINPKQIGFTIVRRHISWVGHRDGPADNERPEVRNQIPMSAFQSAQKEVHKRLKNKKHKRT